MTPFEQSLQRADTITLYCCPFIDDDFFSSLSRQPDSPVRAERRWLDPHHGVTVTRTNQFNLLRQTCQTLTGPAAPEVPQELGTMVFSQRGSHSRDSGRNLLHFPSAHAAPGGLLARLHQMAGRPFYSLGLFEITTVEENDRPRLRQPSELTWVLEFNVCFDLDPQKVRADVPRFLAWLRDWFRQTWQRSVLVTVDAPSSPRLAWFFEQQKEASEVARTLDQKIEIPPAFPTVPVVFKTWALRASSRLQWLGQVGALQRVLQAGRRVSSRAHGILEREIRDRANLGRPDRLRHVGATFNQGRNDLERLGVAIGGPPQFLWRSFFPHSLASGDGDLFDDLEPPPGVLFAVSHDGAAQSAAVGYGLYHDNDPGPNRCLCGASYPTCSETTVVNVAPLRNARNTWIQAQYANRCVSPPGGDHTWTRLSSPHFYFGADLASGEFDEEAALQAAQAEWDQLLAPGGPLGEQV